MTQVGRLCLRAFPTRHLPLASLEAFPPCPALDGQEEKEGKEASLLPDECSLGDSFSTRILPLA